jgi:hypothetical protein
MNNEEMEKETPQNQEEIVEETISEEVAPDAKVEDKTVKSALAQKDHWREKAEKAEAERKALEAKLNEVQKSNVKSKGLDVEDYIDISASLEGLDQREKEYLAKQHKLTGKPLPELRQDEDFKLWQSAYQTKVEKERKAMPPTGTQPESERPATLTERLAKAISIEEKQKILEEAGLYKQNRPRADRTNIGNAIGR